MSGTQDPSQTRLGKYELRKTIGRGAMGTVYDAWDPAIDRRVAIKTVNLADAEDEETAEALLRFKREARAAGALSHHNIVGIYDYGETEHLAYIVMEFVEGRSLKSVIDESRRLQPEEAARIMQQVLAGLAYSHARGVIHRDIKPANIMLTAEGQVKIADFGIARIESSSVTSVGTVMGTPAYMPPEQFLGEAVDARSDIYASGATLFHMLTGERPYEGSLTSIMHRVVNAQAPPSASVRAGTPASFDPVIATAMARNPADRFPNAAAFSAAIAEAIVGATSEQDDATMVLRRPASEPRIVRETVAVPRPPAAEEPKSQTALFAGAALVLLLAAGGAVWLLRPVTPSQPVSSPAAPIAVPPATRQPQALPPAPAPAPSSFEPAAAIAAAFAAQSCTSLHITPGSKPIEIIGLVGSGQAEHAARATAANLAASAGISWSAMSVPADDCPVLDVMKAASDAGDPAASAMAITLNGATGHAALREKTPVVPRITLPNFAAWAVVDYFSSDGTVLHLVPSATRPARQQKASAVIALNASDGLNVFPPFGRDLVVAFASSQRLFTAKRDDSEPTARYIKDLQQALANAGRDHAALATAAIVVDTKSAN